MKFQEKIVLVAGGAGEVGEGMVKVFLQEGARVIVPIRNASKGEGLKEYVGQHPNLELVRSNVADYSSNQHLIKHIVEKYGTIDLVVASLGGWYQKGRLDEVPVDDWLMVMNNNLNSHFVLAKSILEYFHSVNNGTYIMINGGASEMVVPGAGPMSVVAAAQKMMSQVLHAEAKGTHIRVHSVAAFTPVITRSRPTGAPGWIKAEDIGDYVINLYNNGKEEEIIHRLR